MAAARAAQIGGDRWPHGANRWGTNVAKGLAQFGPMAKTPRRSLGKPTKPEACSDAEARRLVKMRQKIADERRECYRMADAKTKAIAAMDAELGIYVDANKTGKARTLTLGKFVLRIVQEFKGLYYKGALLEVLGEEEFNKRVAATPLVDKLEIDILP